MPFYLSSERRATFIQTVRVTSIQTVRCRAICHPPQVLLQVLVMQIMHDFTAMCDGTGVLNARQGRVPLQRCKSFHCFIVAWHFRSFYGRFRVNNRFAASVPRHMHNLTTSERKLRSATRSPILQSSSLSYNVVSSSNKLSIMSSCQLSQLSDMQEASQEHAFDAGGTSKLEPQEIQQWEGANTVISIQRCRVVWGHHKCFCEWRLC